MCFFLFVKIVKTLENLSQALRSTEWVPTAGGETAQTILAQLGAWLDATVLGGGSGGTRCTGGNAGRTAGQG